MEIKNTPNSFFDPYATGLEKNAAARSDARARQRAGTAGEEAGQGDTVSVSQDALLMT